MANLQAVKYTSKLTLPILDQIQGKWAAN